MNLKNLNIILFIIVYAFSIWISKFIFSAVMLVFAVIALRELIHVRKRNSSVKLKIEILYYLILLFFVMNNYGENKIYYHIDYGLFALLFFTSMIPTIIINNKKKYNINDVFYNTCSTIFVGIVFNLLVQYRANNINYCYYLVIISFSGKFFEYVISKMFGKNKILPTITPKKTVEGVCGGVIFGTFSAFLFFISTITVDYPIYLMFLMTFFLSILGKFGEFVFNFVKKTLNRVSFSTFFPGKSGILDLIDNNIFVILGFVLFVSIL